MATSIGVSADANGDLYEIFSDGTKKLKEAGYNDRVLGKDWWRNSGTTTGPQTETIATTTTPATPAVPQTEQQSSNLVTKASVKISTPQYVNFDENVINPIGEGEIVNLFFEQIAGHELLILSNKNFVNTKNIDYQPIANIANFKNTYDPKKIIALQDTSDVYFFNFAINLLTRIPDVPTDSSTNGTNVYIDANGDLIIETKDNASDERVQIEIISGGTIYNDTLGVDES
jgi:hypothetical protein